MDKIPKDIEEKLYSIARHHRRIKELIREVENRYPELKEITDQECGWVWADHIDMQGEYLSGENSIKLLEKYLNHEV